MSNNKYIPLHGGKECKKVTTVTFPHHPDSDNPIMPITEVMAEGETFSGEPIEQHLFYEQQFWIDGTHQNANQTRIAIKPLKAIEPVKERNCSWPNCTKPTCCIYPPLVDVVENKEETVEDAAERYSINRWLGDIADKKGTEFYNGCKRINNPEISISKKDFKAGANWQQSQSIEGIVGFVLEWLNTHAQPMDIVVGGFHNHKSDIIKEYNNGK